MNQGAVARGLDLRGRPRRLPLVVVCENNGWSEMTPIARDRCRSTLAERADGYGIPARSVDGNDPLAVARGGRRGRRAGARRRRADRSSNARPSGSRGHYNRDVEHYRPKDGPRAAAAARPAAAPARERSIAAGERRGGRGRRRRARERRARRGAATDAVLAMPRARPGDRAPSTSTATAAAPAPSGAAAPVRATRADLREGGQRGAAAELARRAPRSSSTARTSAPPAASSASPAGCRRSSATTASSTPRSPRARSSARRSAPHERHAPGRRDHVGRLPARRARPARQPGGERPLRQPRRARARRWSSARQQGVDARLVRPALAEPRGAARAHPRPAVGLPATPAGRLRDAARGGRRSRPVHPHRVARALPDQGRRALDGAARARRRRPPAARRATTSAIITWGRMVHTALEAADELVGARASTAAVLDLRWLAPLDDEAIAAAVASTSWRRPRRPRGERHRRLRRRGRRAHRRDALRRARRAGGSASARRTSACRRPRRSRKPWFRASRPSCSTAWAARTRPYKPRARCRSRARPG